MEILHKNDNISDNFFTVRNPAKFAAKNQRATRVAIAFCSLVTVSVTYISGNLIIISGL